MPLSSVYFCTYLPLSDKCVYFKCAWINLDQKCSSKRIDNFVAADSSFSSRSLSLDLSRAYTHCLDSESKSYRFGPLRDDASQIWRFGVCLFRTQFPKPSTLTLRAPLWRMPNHQTMHMLILLRKSACSAFDRTSKQSALVVPLSKPKMK